MTVKNETAVAAVAFNSKDKARYTRARNAFAKSGATFRATIGELAKAYFDGPCTVAQFAKSAGEDLGMGKGVTAEQKAERNSIRARIHDGLKHADMLKVNQRAAQAQGKRRKAEAAPASTEAADKAQEVAKAVEKANNKAEPVPTQAELFKSIAGMLDHASPATLRRIANAVATKLAAAA